MGFWGLTVRPFETDETVSLSHFGERAVVKELFRARVTVPAWVAALILVLGSYYWIEATFR